MNTEALDTLNDYIDRLRDTCRECEHPICLQHIKSFKQYVDSECLNARINMVDYFDQCPANDLMDWKGLFADTRKLLEAELNTGGNPKTFTQDFNLPGWTPDSNTGGNK